MTSTELVRQDSYARATLAEKREYVAAIAQAGDLLPQSLWTKNQMVNGTMVPGQPSPGKVLLLAETGSMLGLHPMAALTGIHIIEGKPSLSANLLGGLVRNAGHRLRVSTTGSWDDGTFVARAVLIRSDDPDFEFVVEWTPARAKRAGLHGKGNWNKYPEAMAKARAISEVIREGAPDVTLGASYTPEELGAQVEGEDGTPIELQAQRPQQSAAKPQAPIIDETPEPAPKPRKAEKPQEPISEPQSAPADDEPVDAEIVDEGPAQPQEQAFTPEQQAKVDEAEQTDWVSLIAEAATLEDVRGIYRDASEQGLLGLTITWGGEERPLGAVVTEIGRKFAEMDQADSE